MPNTKKYLRSSQKNSKKRTTRVKSLKQKRKMTKKKIIKKRSKMLRKKQMTRKKKGARGKGKAKAKGTRRQRSELGSNDSEELPAFARLRQMEKDAKEREEEESRSRRWNLGDSDKYTVPQMLAMLRFEHKKNEFNKDYKNKPVDAQKRFLDTALFEQQRNDDTIQKYKDERENYMVEEPGMMPYDSRLFYESRHDETRKPEIKVSPIKYFDLNSNSEAERLKAQWQRRYANTVFDINAVITSPMVDKSFLRQKREQYDKDFKDFYTNDPEYLAAVERDRERQDEKVKQGRERRIMDKEEEADLKYIRDEKNAKFDEWKTKEKEIRKDEEQEYGDDYTITWEGVKRRGLDVFEDKKTGNMMAKVYDIDMNDHPDHGYDAEILFLSPKDVYEAYSEFVNKYPKSNIDRAQTDSDAATALTRVKSVILKSWAESKNLATRESRSKPGRFLTRQSNQWVVDEPVPSTPIETERTKNKEERIKRQTSGRGDMVADMLKMMKRKDYPTEEFLKTYNA